MACRTDTRLILAIILACASVCLADLVDPTYEWKYIDYVWESDDAKAAAVANGSYNLEGIIPNDVQPLSDGRVLVTTPRYFANNPASLSTISSKSGDGGPLLEPYPNWRWHTKTDCSGITSVNDLFLDDYNRLWLVDSGKIKNEQVCPAKLLVIDTIKDKLLMTVRIPNKLSHNPNDTSKGLLSISSVPSAKKSLKDTWAYISDIEGFGLLVSNGSKIWRIDSPVFFPDPEQSTLTIAGENVTLTSCGPTTSIHIKHEWLKAPAMLFKPTCSIKAFGVSHADLRNSYTSSPIFYVSEFSEPSPETARVFSKKYQIFIGGFTGSMVACWNSNNTLAIENIGILAVNETTLPYISSIKSKEESCGSETVYVMSNRLQKKLLGDMDFTEVNFRVFTFDLETVINGTVCEAGSVVQVDSIKDKAFNEWSESS